MHLVAIHHVQGPPEEAAARLAAVLGMTPYEARPRIMAATTGPAVVGRYAAAAAAAERAEDLAAAGFSVLTMNTDDDESSLQRFMVRSLTFAETGLRAAGRDGATVEIPYPDIELLVRGMGINSALQTEVSRERKFNLGRAVVTGGLVMSKTKKNVTERVVEERDQFCAVVSRNRSVLMLQQAAMDFEAFGADRQPSREANFAWACAQLRQRCPAARWDDRLQSRAGQVLLLGPGLSPEQHLDLAIELLIRSQISGD